MIIFQMPTRKKGRWLNPFSAQWVNTNRLTESIVGLTFLLTGGESFAVRASTERSSGFWRAWRSLIWRAASGRPLRP